jgi:DNA-binding CsgD family transcriptional regulator
MRLSIARRSSLDPVTLDHARRHERELSETQWRVLRLIDGGQTNAEIAEKLGITLDGAKWHVSEILSKLGVRTREEAASYWRWRSTPEQRLSRALAPVFSARRPEGARRWCRGCWGRWCGGRRSGPSEIQRR